MIKTVECSHPRWPFLRRSTAWLTTPMNLERRVPFPFRDSTRELSFRGILTLCLLGCLLTARAQDPRLTNPGYPLDTNVSVGATVSFRAFATTTNAPLRYQWQHDGTNLLNATNVTLLITNVTIAHAGGYLATITNASGAYTNTRTAILTVDPTFTKITQGPVVEDREPSIGGIWGDYDGDGRLDLFVSNSGGVYRNTLYRNLGGDQFVRVTNALTALAAYTWGAQWADMDNDGDLDILINHPFKSGTGREQNELFRNDGGGVFTRMTNTVTAVAAWWTDASWVDHDGDGWLDIFATTQSFMGAQSYDNYFFQNLADGRFAAWTTNEVGAVVKPHSETAGPAWCDIDGDGDLDLYVSKYQGATNFLYRNDGGRLIPVTAGSLPAARSTWAAIWADFNNDGLFDLFTTGEDGTNMFHLNRGNWLFEDATVASGLVLAGTVYNPTVGDFDNDGDPDLYVAVYDAADVLYVNRGDATFDRVNVGSPLTEGSRNSATWVDYNNDGFLDLFQGCGEITPTLNLLYRNSLPQYGNTNHWLKLRLKGTASNASAIGARVWARAIIGGKETWQVRQIVSGFYGVGSTDGLLVHFGLGDATHVDLLRIEWPSGNVQEISNLIPVDRLITFTETIPIIPVRPSASLNGSVTLTRSVLAGASYQWRLEGVDLVGQTNRILNLTNILAIQQGHYSVVASNATTFITNFVYLSVDTQFSKITTGPVVAGNESGWACTWADYDDDGDIDLLVGNGPEAAGLERMGLFRNDGTAGFVRLTNEVGSLVSELGRFGGGIWADYDNDGALDCLVMDWTSTSTALALHRNLGNGMFRRETAPPLTQGIPGYVSWVDYDNDGWLDVFDAMAWSDGGIPTNALFRALGFGAFTFVNTGILVKDTFVGLEGAAWGDFDGDGDQDLLATDFHAWRRNSSAYPNRFYRNDGGGVFTRITNNAIALDQTSSLVPAWADYDNDGRLDLFLTCYDETSRLFHNDGNGQFTRILMGPGLETAQPAWGDYDNDGDLDLYISRGQGTATTSLFYLNNGDGTFSAITLGSPANDLGRSGSCIWGDYDNDGFLDLFVARNRGGQDALYHNNGNGNHWLLVKLVGTTSNRSAIGAKVRAYAKVQGKFQWQLRDIQGGNRCQNDPRAHFGLETSTNVTTLRIEWPSGTVQELSNVATKQMLTIVEPRRPVLTLEATPAGSTGALKADPNQTYQIHASDDVTTGWTILTNITSDVTGTAYWSDTAPSPQGYRFYKAVKTP